jgi:hypothetical protein
MRTSRHTDVSDTPENQEHLAIGLPPIEKKNTLFLVDRRYVLITFLVLMSLLGYWLSQADHHVRHTIATSLATLLSSEYFWLAVGVGLAAQIVDGALGMAYGVTSNSFLLGIGATPVAASSAVHVAEIFTTAFSGVSHIRFGNVDKELFKKILQ